MSFYYQISVIASPELVEMLSDLFLACEANAITMTDAKDEPLFQLTPEDEPLWQHTTVHALFDASSNPEIVIEHIQQTHPEFKTLDFHIEKIADANWVEVTQKQFHAQLFGRLWICPEWEKVAWEKQHGINKEPVVFIEPGLAFGTGTHPTTQLCLTWLADNDLKNKTVIDYGCGSGILALAAMALDAKEVWATDHDEQALISTRNNAQYNAFHQALHIVNTKDIRTTRADVVVANILANPLIELAPVLTALLLPQGKLILSGVLHQDADRVYAAYKGHFIRSKIQQKGEWVLMELGPVKE